MTFKYVEGGPVQLNDVCFNKLDSVFLNGRAGQGKASRR